MVDYREDILKKMLAKLKKRSNPNRRVFLKATELYRGYEHYNADMEKKGAIDQAATELCILGFIGIDRVKFGSDIQRMYLVEDNVSQAELWLEDKYGILSGKTIGNRIRQLCDKYCKQGESENKLTLRYAKELLNELNDPGHTTDPNEAEDIFKMLKFFDENTENVYVREASMLVYGDSKYFENEMMDKVCRVIGEVIRADETAAAYPQQSDGVSENNKSITDSYEFDNKNESESLVNLDILKLYHVLPGEQEIRIKGDWRIWFSDEGDRFDGRSVDVNMVPGGISISTAALDEIVRISCGSIVMTVENKTSFERMPEDGRSYLYLGGFASEGQIAFLKMIDKSDEREYMHFGDIDAGGLWIHRNLKLRTGIDYSMYRMGVSELKDIRFERCLLPLTDNDRVRLNSLLEIGEYGEVINYMLDNDVKLEQEIVSYYECSSEGD